ncbi:MAG: hypothetical protein ACFB9M_21420 [Myxococcota bacterium]
MAYRLQSRGIDLVAFDVAASAGTAWACMNRRCGVHKLPGLRRKSWAADGAAFRRFDAPTAEGFAGVYRIKSLTAAQPARTSSVAPAID